MQSPCERDQEGPEKIEKVASAQSCLNSQAPLTSFHVHPSGRLSFSYCFSLVSFCSLQSRAMWDRNGFQNQQQVLGEDM